MVVGRVCLGALGFGLCYGLLFGFGGLLCFGIIVLIVGRFSMRVADPGPQLWGKGFKGMGV